jgi:hypothetical protein
MQDSLEGESCVKKKATCPLCLLLLAWICVRVGVDGALETLTSMASCSGSV